MKCENVKRRKIGTFRNTDMCYICHVLSVTKSYFSFEVIGWSLTSKHWLPLIVHNIRYNGLPLMKVIVPLHMYLIMMSSNVIIVIYQHICDTYTFGLIEPTYFIFNTIYHICITCLLLVDHHC
jgi:hypothetical protein